MTDADSMKLLLEFFPSLNFLYNLCCINIPLLRQSSKLVRVILDPLLKSARLLDAWLNSLRICIDY